MPVQSSNWSCSIYSYRWVVQSTQTDPTMSYAEAEEIIGYPNCVNATYGLMSAQCMVDAFTKVGLRSVQKWCSFGEAYSICEKTTGVINPIGMYHFMAIRGVADNNIWLANSAPGYMGVNDILTSSQFNSFGPVQLIYLE